MSVWQAKSVECTASTFPLDNLTRVSGCAFYQEFIIKSFLNLSAAFWHLVLLYCLYLVVLTGAGPNIGSLSCHSWKYSWRWGLTQLQWVFPLSDGHRRPTFPMLSPVSLLLINRTETATFTG